MTRVMDATLTSRNREAHTLLLRHVLALGTERRRPPARVRLEEAIGRDLTRLLLSGLAARGPR